MPIGRGRATPAWTRFLPLVFPQCSLVPVPGSTTLDMRMERDREIVKRLAR